MTVCPNCGNEAQDTAVFCDQCGTRLKEQETVAAAVVETAEPAAAEGVRCAACGYPNVPGELFCENCGVALEALEPEPAASAEPVEAAPVAAETPETPVEAAPAVEAVEAPVEATPAESAPAAPAAPEPVVEAPPATGATCPACGASVSADDEFCDNCGAALKEAAAPAPAPETAPAPQPAPEPAVAGPRLVVADTGAEIPLPADAEILVGREDPISGIFPDVDLTPHGGEEGGVSRKHLRIRSQNGSYTVEDLDSTNFSFVNRQRLAPGSPQPIKDGDELRLGRVRLVFKVG